jgi:PhzF family phenazine biosynthesis protein
VAFGVVLQDVLSSIGLHTNDLIVGCEPMLVNTGNSFIVILVKSDTILAGVAPDQDAIDQISDRFDLIGYYPFAMSPDSAETVATTRMFAPHYAIPEESATGMAAGPLACYLHDIMHIKETPLKVAQGHFMKPASPSLITVDLETAADGKVTSLMAGGYGRSMREMKILLT